MMTTLAVSSLLGKLSVANQVFFNKIMDQWGALNVHRYNATAWGDWVANDPNQANLDANEPAYQLFMKHSLQTQIDACMIIKIEAEKIRNNSTTPAVIDAANNVIGSADYYMQMLADNPGKSASGPGFSQQGFDAWAGLTQTIEELRGDRGPVSYIDEPEPAKTDPVKKNNFGKHLYNLSPIVTLEKDVEKKEDPAKESTKEPEKKTNTTAILVGGGAGAVMGGALGYAMSKPDNRSTRVALGAAAGGLAGALVGYFTAPKEEPKDAATAKTP